MTTAELAQPNPSRKLEFRPHRGQWRAWQSEKRFILILAGTQSGKTALGPHWLYREIQRRGPGDYLVVTPTFQLLEKKALPEFRRLFERWLEVGRYVASPARRFAFSESGARRTFGSWNPDHPTTVWFGYADDPESLESATAKAAWLDEAGQRRFKLASWEAVQRRLAIHEGRALITTTPYDLGWVKQKLWNLWQESGGRHPEIEVIRFASTENPRFPVAEFERARRVLPRWKFDLFYRGIFTRPAGMIYDAFKDEPLPLGHRVPRFPIPAGWPRHLGLDFGNVNTAGYFLAAEPNTGRYFLYRTYHTGGRSEREHVEALLKDEPRLPAAVGGAPSEDEWRQRFAAAGLPVSRPFISDVEVGINAVYRAHREDRLLVFDDLDAYLEQKLTYSRKLDAAGEPTTEIEDKHSFHLLDAERYLVSQLCGGGGCLAADASMHAAFWNRAPSGYATSSRAGARAADLPRR